jgi:putative PEP-CTERM system histidine kinase
MTVAASPLLHAAAAILCFGWAGLIILMGRRRMAGPHAVSCIVAGAWAGSVALSAAPPWPSVAEVLRSGTWVAVLLWLSLRSGDARMRPIAARFALAGMAVMLFALAAFTTELGTSPTLGSPALLGPLALALLVVLVAENVYRNAEEAARWHVILPCIALGGLSAFDVVLHADAALTRGYSPALIDARAALTALALALLVVAAARDRRWKRNPPVSRQVVFHGATLIIAGTFLVGVGAVGEVLQQLGSDWGRAAQVSLLAGAVMVLAVAASSRSMRSHIRRIFVDHFFAARYDYRREWLRCVATLSAHGADAQGRAIIAVADPVDSPAGLLLVQEPGEPGLRWAGSWNMPEVPMTLAPDHPLIASLREGRWVTTRIPDDLVKSLGPLWLAVPLLHHRVGLLGVILLAPPRAPFALDGEVFDLLRTAGREVAMFLAERRAAERLNDQRRLQEYASRFAFVAHDVKTVAHQLSMLLTNAEDHMDDPEFQRDMLLTVGASAQRINALIARLRQPAEGSAGGEAGDALHTDPIERLRALLPQIGHPVSFEADELDCCDVAIAPENFDSALRHLLDNAAEASPNEEPIRVSLRREGSRLVLDISDRGPGMTAEFVRDTLFRPLISGRADGNGIGAWQARDLLRGAGGDLAVLSLRGAGTTMRITLPCAAVPDAQPSSRKAIVA